MLALPADEKLEISDASASFSQATINWLNEKENNKYNKYNVDNRCNDKTKPPGAV